MMINIIHLFYSLNVLPTRQKEFNINFKEQLLKRESSKRTSLVYNPNAGYFEKVLIRCFGVFFPVNTEVSAEWNTLGRSRLVCL